MIADIFAAGFRPEPYWWDDVPRDDTAGLPAAALPSRADVVVIGSGRLAPPRRAFLGSMSARILRNTDAPIIVVPKDFTP